MNRPVYLAMLLVLTVGLLAVGCAAGEEFYAMTAADCYDDETFVAEDQYCYLTCELEGTCAENPSLLDFISSFISDLGNLVLGAPADANVLILYDVNGDTISNPVEGEPLTDEEADILGDTQRHTEMWQHFATLIPVEQRRDIASFGVFTDGEENTMAYVEPNQNDPTRWNIVMDAVDAENRREQQYTLIHEFGHVLTLNNRQVPFDEAAYNDDNAFDEAAAACPRFFTGEGCANGNSYINAFFEQFWADIYDELPQDPEDYDAIDAFYEQYQDRFVTDYAATNPGEDIAESWTHFVLNDRPTGNTIANQKVQFFYDYPELVELREQIQARLYSQSRR